MQRKYTATYKTFAALHDDGVKIRHDDLINILADMKEALGETIKWLESNINQTDKNEVSEIACIYEHVLNHDKAKEYWQKAAKLGNMSGYFALGLHALLEPTPTKAFNYFKQGIENHSQCQVMCAHFYLFGCEVKEDHQQAFKLYEKAADINPGSHENMMAKSYLAFCYLNGIGVTLNPAKGLELLKFNHHDKVALVTSIIKEINHQLVNPHFKLGTFEKRMQIFFMCMLTANGLGAIEVPLAQPEPTELRKPNLEAKKTPSVAAPVSPAPQQSGNKKKKKKKSSAAASSEKNAELKNEKPDNVKQDSESEKSADKSLKETASILTEQPSPSQQNATSEKPMQTQSTLPHEKTKEQVIAKAPDVKEKPKAEPAKSSVPASTPKKEEPKAAATEVKKAEADQPKTTLQKTVEKPKIADVKTKSKKTAKSPQSQQQPSSNYDLHAEWKKDPEQLYSSLKTWCNDETLSHLLLTLKKADNIRFVKEFIVPSLIKLPYNTKKIKDFLFNLNSPLAIDFIFEIGLIPALSPDTAKCLSEWEKTDQKIHSVILNFWRTAISENNHFKPLKKFGFGAIAIEIFNAFSQTENYKNGQYPSDAYVDNLLLKEGNLPRNFKFFFAIHFANQGRQQHRFDDKDKKHLKAVLKKLVDEVRKNQPVKAVVIEQPKSEPKTKPTQHIAPEVKQIPVQTPPPPAVQSAANPPETKLPLQVQVLQPQQTSRASLLDTKSAAVPVVDKKEVAPTADLVSLKYMKKWLIYPWGAIEDLMYEHVYNQDEYVKKLADFIKIELAEKIRRDLWAQDASLAFIRKDFSSYRTPLRTVLQINPAEKFKFLRECGILDGILPFFSKQLQLCSLNEDEFNKFITHCLDNDIQETIYHLLAIEAYAIGKIAQGIHTQEACVLASIQTPTARLLLEDKPYDKLCEKINEKLTKLITFLERSNKLPIKFEHDTEIDKLLDSKEQPLTKIAQLYHAVCDNKLTAIRKPDLERYKYKLHLLFGNPAGQAVINKFLHENDVSPFQQIIFEQLGLIEPQQEEVVTQVAAPVTQVQSYANMQPAMFYHHPQQPMMQQPQLQVYHSQHQPNGPVFFHQEQFVRR